MKKTRPYRHEGKNYTGSKALVIRRASYGEDASVYMPRHRSAAFRLAEEGVIELIGDPNIMVSYRLKAKGE